MKYLNLIQKGFTVVGFFVVARAVIAAFRDINSHAAETVSDHAGHYDIDGVSYDRAVKVVISSDARTPSPDEG